MLVRIMVLSPLHYRGNSACANSFVKTVSVALITIVFRLRKLIAWIFHPVMFYTMKKTWGTRTMQSQMRPVPIVLPSSARPIQTTAAGWRYRSSKHAIAMQSSPRDRCAPHCVLQEPVVLNPIWRAPQSIVICMRHATMHCIRIMSTT